MNEPINRAELKRKAKVYIQKSNPSPWLVVLCAVAMQNALSLLSSRIINFPQAMAKIQQAFQTFMITNDMDRYMEEYFQAIGLVNTSLGAQAIYLLLALVSTMFSIGMIIYFLQVVRLGKGSFGNLLDGLSVLLRVIGYYIISSIFIFLWSLLFIIPGIIATLRYSQGIYLLLTHPEMGIMDCLRASKELMRGREGEYFVLRLSFLSWLIGLRIVNIGLSFTLGVFSLLIFIPLAVFVEAYLGFTLVLYHEAIQGRTYDPTQPPPPQDPELPIL